MQGIRAAKIARYTEEKRDIASLCDGVAFGFKPSSRLIHQLRIDVIFFREIYEKEKGREPEQNENLDNHVCTKIFDASNFITVKLEKVQ